jgi:hypothetical protein
MINNARAESGARLARTGEGALHGESVSDFGEEREKRSSLPLGESEGEASGYDDDFDGLRSRRAMQSIAKRESI